MKEKKNTHISHVESHEMHENRKSHRVFKMVTKNNQPNVQLNPFSYVGFFSLFVAVSSALLNVHHLVRKLEWMWRARETSCNTSYLITHKHRRKRKNHDFGCTKMHTVFWILFIDELVSYTLFFFLSIFLCAYFWIVRSLVFFSSSFNNRIKIITAT